MRFEQSREEARGTYKIHRCAVEEGSGSKDCMYFASLSSTRRYMMALDRRKFSAFFFFLKLLDTWAFVARCFLQRNCPCMGGDFDGGLDRPSATRQTMEEKSSV